MKTKKDIITIIGVVLAVIVFGLLEFFLVKQLMCPSQTKEGTTEGMMVLIEYEDMTGLSNMVNELYQRDIYALLHVGPDFVEENCEEIKKLTNYNVSLVGGCGDELWNLDYDEQKQVISETKQRIEACTGKPLKFVTSRYWGWDYNTVKIADELGIENIFARGLVENGAAVFKPEGYNVKILSVSNIKSVDFKYGSVCDYSFWIRDGQPNDMLAELNDAIDNYDKITPVSHTNLGGLKKDWVEMWKSFFDSSQVEWVSWEEFSDVDYQMPLNRIPINKNVPYTPEMRQSRDELYQKGEEVNNPCSVDDLPEVTSNKQESGLFAETEVVMFHNNKGPMCLEANEFFADNNIDIKEVLTDQEDFSEQLSEYKQKYPQSEGVSDSYGYYPFIFTENKAYSGFNNEIENELLQSLQK